MPNTPHTVNLGTPHAYSVTGYQTFTLPTNSAEAFDSPSSESVYDHGTLIAETTYGYDGYGQTGYSIAPVTAYGHDDTNYSPSVVGRGNLTSITRACLQSCTDSTTSYTYDETGQVVSATDANLNKTTYSYADKYATGTGSPSGNTNTYVTTITMPIVNGVSHIQSYTYGFNDGKMRTSTDENSKITQYCYYTGGCSGSSEDPWARLTGVSYPDGGSSIESYVDSGPNPSSTVSTAINASTTETSTTVLDAYGHVIKTQLTSDPYGTDTVDTVYNGFGQVYTTSNPYRTTSEPTYGLTTYAYDSLGRKTIATNPDGTAKQWCYNNTQSSGQTNCNQGPSGAGAWVDVADENGSDSQETLNALGQMTSVAEPNGTGTLPSMTTIYTYDALNNLQSVTQNGVVGTDTPRTTRSFSYDGMSRLISAFNPESGTITYGYDPNGNLQTKTSPAQNGASGTQTIGYCYDALNRMTYKFYTGSFSCTSPSGYASAYAYDGTMLPGSLITPPPPAGIDIPFLYATGRLTDEQQLSGSTVISERVLNSYDPMGRLLHEFVAPYGSASEYTFGYGYDLAGDLTSTVNNSAGGIGIGYTYDAAARLSTVTSSLTSDGSTTYPSPLYQVNSYGPAGLSSATYGITGTNAGIFNRFRYYNNRARLMNDEVYPLTDAFGTASVTISGTENLCASGSGGSCAAETGTVSITAGTLTETTTYGATSTAQSIGTALTADINQSGSEGSNGVTAALGTSGPGCNSGMTTATPSVPCAVITLTAVEFGVYGNMPLTAIDTYANGSGPSFSAVSSGTALTGGTGTPQGGPAYETTLTYRPNGNVASATDPFEGYWIYRYDTLNRLTSGSFESYEGTGVVTPSGTFAYQCWAYDSFGNRTNELETNSGCPSTLTNGTSTHWTQYNSTNQVTKSDTGGLVYDAAGNVIEDATNRYVYDLEGRLCAVENLLTTSATQYVYDADGRRVSKGTIATFPALGNTCAAPTSANGFTLSSQYLLASHGEQETELTTVVIPVFPPPPVPLTETNWHTNVFAGGVLLATYNYVDNGLAGTVPDLEFNFADWQGTKRLQTTDTGQVSLWWSSDPFGAYLHATGSGSDATEQHFTGKERDTESGNDYFGARYYANSMGRFMNPDPSGLFYADPTNPQSLNLYSYALNNPLKFTDPTGMYCDYNDPDEDQDSSGFDYHSSKSECESNSGTWINDSQTHQDDSGDWVDNADRDESFGITPQDSAPGLPVDTNTSVWQNSAYQLTAYAPIVTAIIPIDGIPVPIASLGLSPSVTYIPKSKTLCVGGALTVALGTGKSFGASMFVSNDAQKSKDVISGWGWTLNTQPTPFLGESLATNSSGTLVGPSVATSSGGSAGYGYTWCANF